MRKSIRPVGSIMIRIPVAYPGERIGLMGGSFDPPHAGHLVVSRTALKRLGLTRIWWLVTPGNPLKSAHRLSDIAHRIGLCRALATRPDEIVTGFEAALGTRYTADTLAFLGRRHPRVRFVWVMGADGLAGFHHWRDWRGIAHSVPLAVVDRPGWRLAAAASPAARFLLAARHPEDCARALASRRPPAWTILGGRLSGLSSTAIRAHADGAGP